MVERLFLKSLGSRESASRGPLAEGTLGAKVSGLSRLAHFVLRVAEWWERL